MFVGAPLFRLALPEGWVREGIPTPSHPGSRRRGHPQRLAGSRFFSNARVGSGCGLGLAGVVVLLGGLFGWSAYRKRKAGVGESFKDTSEGLQANSLFGATGGQSVDTGTSTFNSSFIPAASGILASPLNQAGP